MAKGKKQSKNLEPRIENRRAFRDYHISEKLECGIQLQGTEVKSIRLGQASIAEGYASVETRGLKAPELFLYNIEVAVYPHSGSNIHAAKRPRKLLAHRRQIKSLQIKTLAKGTTLVPLAMYFVDGRIKVEIGLATGKQDFDKRQDIKKRDVERDIRRAMSKRV